MLNNHERQEPKDQPSVMDASASSSASPARRVLITGASGAVGCAVAKRFSQGGYRVRVLDQSPFPVALAGSEPEMFRGDIGDTDLLRAAVEGVDLVVHMAAKLHINNPDPSLRDEYVRVNVEGTRRLVSAAGAAKVPRFIFFSTICVYGASVPPNIFDEGSPINPDSWYAETKYEGERIVLQNIPGVVLRPAAIYGPRMKGNYLRLLGTLRKGYFVGIGRGGNRRTLIFDEDLADAAFIVGEHHKALGRIYNATDGQIHTFADIVQAMCQALGKKPPRWRLPAAPIKAAARLAELCCSAIGRRWPITPALVDKIIEDAAVNGTRLENELSFAPKVNLLDGWRKVVAAVFPDSACTKKSRNIPAALSSCQL